MSLAKLPLLNSFDQAEAPGSDPAAEMPSEAARSAIRTVCLERQGLAVLEDALAGPLGAALERAVALIAASSGHVIVTGMGKSGHVGRKISATLASTGTPSHFVHPAEASHGDLGVLRATDVVLALSWSGESPELSDIVAYTRRFDIPLIAITAHPESALGQAADIGLFLPVSAEACPNGLAPTTSTTMQMVLGDALAVNLLERHGFSAHDFQRFHPGGKLGAQLMKAGALMHRGDEIPLVSQHLSLSQAIVEMTSKRFGITGVIDDEGNLIGAVTDGDLRRAFTRGFADGPVTAVMSRTPQSFGPDILAAEILKHMKGRITCVFIVDGRKPIGLVHIHDLLLAGVA